MSGSFAPLELIIVNRCNSEKNDSAPPQYRHGLGLPYSRSWRSCCFNRCGGGSEILVGAKEDTLFVVSTVSQSLQTWKMGEQRSQHGYSGDDASSGLLPIRAKLRLTKRTS